MYTGKLRADFGQSSGKLRANFGQTSGKVRANFRHGRGFGRGHGQGTGTSILKSSGTGKGTGTTTLKNSGKLQARANFGHACPSNSVLNIENVNFEEIWFEFEYYEGLFDATQVQLAAILEQEDDF